MKIEILLLNGKLKYIVANEQQAFIKKDLITKLKLHWAIEN